MSAFDHHRLSWRPLRDFAEAEVLIRTARRLDNTINVDLSRASAEEIGEVLGIDRRTVARRDNDASVFWIYADTEAVHMGYHPALIWGQEWWDLMGRMSEDYTTKLNERRDKASATRRAHRLSQSHGASANGAPLGHAHDPSASCSAAAHLET